MELINTFIDYLQGGPLRKVFEWRTEVVSFDSGAEQRAQILSEPRRHWIINWPMLPKANRDKLIELFQRAAGRYNTFKYLDSEDENGSCSYTQAKIEIYTAVSTTKTFTVIGNYTSVFKDGVHFAIASSTNNTGDFIVDGDSTYSSDTGLTSIVVTDSVVDADPENGHILKKEFQLFTTYYSGETEEWTENRVDIQPNETTVTVAGNPKTRDVDYTLDDTTGIVIFEDGKAPTDGQTIVCTFKFYYRVRFNTDTHLDLMPEVSYYEANDIELIEVKP